MFTYSVVQVATGSDWLDSSNCKPGVYYQAMIIGKNGANLVGWLLLVVERRVGDSDSDKLPMDSCSKQ